MRELLAAGLLVLSGVAVTIGSLIEWGAGVALVALAIWAFTASIVVGLDA